eukprot:6338207-Alexandrium_andersonii.AAC.1
MSPTARGRHYQLRHIDASVSVTSMTSSARRLAIWLPPAAKRTSLPPFGADGKQQLLHIDHLEGDPALALLLG